MMYAKLALRNVRRTARDYLIYVVTLVLSVGMFYGFFSLVSPYYNATLPVPIHLDVLKKMMRIAVPLVGLFVVFLMSYVNSYMLRRKQKEFAIETIIGMEQKTVAFLESTVEVVYESEPSSEEVVLDRLPLMDVIENGALLEALQKLNERERQMFLARTLEEEDFDTLGAKFGLSYKGVAALYYRTIQKIRKSIEGGDKR